MADNYLEKKFEQYQENKGNVQKKVVNNLSLNSLLLKNRSYRGYDSSYIVSKEELLKIADVMGCDAGDMMSFVKDNNSTVLEDQDDN